MLFLDFLWIFVFIVFLNARPIFKSMTNNLAGNNISMRHNMDLIKRNQDFNIFDGDETHKDRYEIKKNLKFRKKVACKKTNDFDKYELPKYYGKYGDIHTDYKKVTNNTREMFKPTEIDALKKEFNYITTTPSLLDISILENSNNFFDFSSPTSSNEDTEILGTAEIEAVLNEIKHKEIQMIADHETSLAKLITNTIVPKTYSSTLDLKAYSNNYRYTTTRSIKETKTKLLNHLFQRSIKEECSTLAQNIENKLHKKIKNVFNRVKNKISHDYNKEIKNTKEAVKQKFEEITNKFCNSTKRPNKDLKNIQPTKSTQQHPSYTTIANLRNTRSTTKFKPLKIHRNTCSISTNHALSTLGDEISMLTIIEQLLSNGQENGVINTLTSKRNSVKKVERSPKHNRYNSSDNQDIYNVKEYPSTDLDIENKIGFLETVTTNDQSDATTEDTSFEALSNKLSYNDYVNGYKYYLNYQKEQDDNKFSNLIRYQAHKHHNVDDIGKFILNKIPQIPTSKYKRHFVEAETLEDQDVSTKSEDSWFKKHFFIFVDTDPPKQFHSTQTVTCKNNNLQKNNSFILRNNTFMHKRYIMKREDLNDIRQQNSFKLSNNKSNPHINEDVTFHTRSTAKVKLQKKKDKKRIHTVKIFHHKSKQKHKREDCFRIQRFNIFKGIKDSLKYQPKYTRTRLDKLHEYEIMSSPQPYDNFKIKKLYNVDEMMKQVPNISEYFGFPFPVLDLKYNKLNEYSLQYTTYKSQEFPFQKHPDDQRKPIVDCAKRSFFTLPVTTPARNLEVNKVNKSNVIDTSANTGGRHHTSMYLMKSTKIAQNKNTLYENNYANSNGDSVINKNYINNITFLENLNEQPKHYFMTPLPMKMEDFNIFLKDHQIDVESVTAPLRHPVPFSTSIIDKWKFNKKYIPKSLTH